ncbi:tripartite tricarboxylate transporter TctB family protein [Desulforhopalus singaporensis]|uniref:Tripartite tricarboxylate transporter TctB family protein n=1 Tax=Desulforhopalus singaporensis TaxID=91360 RepID=A0A1H0UE05_9BACT|nr:tripartite tricarboxylate transporter TctB family protein [Desulforhopalus singaporensis]SDP64467.1 Tripartite tricarboxylate transporter TctB family protein [Desulforhopalus singaporensis]
MTNVQKNRIFALGTLILSLYLGYESFSYPGNSSLFPRVLVVVMGFLGFLFFLRQTLLSKKIKPSPGNDGTGSCSVASEKSSADKTALASAGLVFGSIGIYALLVGLVNYEAATVIFMATMMPVLRFSKKRWIIVISCGLMALLWAIFFHLLGVTRPESLIFG